ncbi:hypothetical protein [Bosea sp. BK604]|uniref:hypothetical protein n=1 Tax=Bosea sp. BK604 TaxID=2512180 RepID=UPI0010504578|nr:hypothetical protein [Bosea sp. BK604]TCR69713.1 hypothetical protein EV560_101110 [Bosea sp. BK604]
MGPGQFKPGSLSQLVLARIREGGAYPVTRLQLRRSFPDRDKFIGRALDRLIGSNLVRETPKGFLSSDAPPQAPFIERAPAEPLSPATRLNLAAIVNLAHRYRGAGMAQHAVSLMDRACAVKSLPVHVREDLLALADLFRCGEHLYGEAPAARAA